MWINGLNDIENYITHPHSCIICTRSVLSLFDRMASRDSSVFLLEKVSCPKCKDTYKNPKRLPCLHSVCLHCLEELQRKSSSHDTVVCPTCKQESKIEGRNLGKLPDSPYIASLCEVLRIMSSKTSLMKCCFCNKEPTSLQGTYKYCSQCCKFLCDHHSAMHPEHHVLGAGNDLGDILKSLKPSTYCKKKDHEEKELELFCKVCNTAICVLCSHSEHESHSNKKVLKTVAVEHKTEMEALIDDELEQAKKKMVEISQLGKECDDVVRQAEEIEVEVNAFFRYISERLEEERKKMLAEAKDVATRSRELLEERKRLLQNQEKVIRITMDTTSVLLKHTTSSDVVDLKKALDRIVNEVKEEERANYDPDRKPLQMSFLKTQELTDILNTKGIGFLQTESETSAEQCTVDGKGIRKATVGIEARFQLTTKNAAGNCYQNKTDRVKVEFRNEEGEECVTGVRIQDNEDGSYKISYFAKECGAIKASVRVNGDHVHGSPFDVEVKSREFRLEKSFGKTVEENMGRWGLAVSDNDEKIAVTQSMRNRVQLFKLSNTDSFFSVYKPGPLDGSFASPSGIVFDKKGRLLVSDPMNCVVHIFSGNGKYEGAFGEKGELDYQLMSPHGLSIDENGQVIVTDNKEIKIFSPDGEFLRKFGGGSKEDGCLNLPCHCVQCGKYLVVSDTHDHAIKIFNREGSFLGQFGTEGDGEQQFFLPRGLAVDKLGHLLVCDTGNGRVSKFELSDSNVKFKGIVGTRGSKYGEIDEPYGVEVLSDGRIVVMDNGSKSIQVIE